jgi:hypothetical protein
LDARRHPMLPYYIYESREHLNPVRSFGEREGEVYVSKMLEGGRSRHIYMLLRSEKRSLPWSLLTFRVYNIEWNGSFVQKAHSSVPCLF